MCVETIIKPRACYISKEITKINGITNEIANANGIDPEIVLNEFKKDIKNVDIIINHNIDFHLKTIIAESVRFNISIDFNKYIIIDIMLFNKTNTFYKLSDLIKKYLKKSKDNTLTQIKKIFFQQYQEYLLP